MKTVMGNKFYNVKGNGFVEIHEAVGQIESMISPVLCLHCGKIYDLASGTPQVRFTDCTQFKTPCCKITVDDRTWKSFSDFKRLKDI